MRSRLWPFAQVALVVLSLFIIPACGANNKLAPPTLVAVLPDPMASADVGIFPNIVVKFDRAMDPGTAGNKNNYAVIKKNATSGVALDVEFLPALNSVRIIPSAKLDTNADYTVVVSGLVTSAEGTPMGANIGFFFDTINATVISGPIAFTGLAAATGGNSGEITLTWNTATEPLTAGGSQNVTTYKIYASTSQGGGDLMVTPTKTSNNLGGDTLTGLTAGATYYIRVQPVDGEGNVFTNIGPTEVSAQAKP